MMFEALADSLPPIENAANSLVQTGVLGTCLVLVGAYALWATREMIKSKDSRTDDAQKVTQTLLTFTQTMQTVMTDLKGAIEKLTTASGEERKAIEDVGKTVDGVKAQNDIIARDVGVVTRNVDDLARKAK